MRKLELGALVLALLVFGADEASAQRRSPAPIWGTAGDIRDRDDDSDSDSDRDSDSDSDSDSDRGSGSIWGDRTDRRPDRADRRSDRAERRRTSERRGLPGVEWPWPTRHIDAGNLGEWIRSQSSRER